MEQLKAMYPVCTLIKSDGNRCGSPALTGANFCFQHLGGSARATRARAASGANAKLKFVYPGDREAIQHNLFLVAQALSDGNMDNATANTYNRLFRTCDLNLRRWETTSESDAEKRMLPLPNETPEPAEQQSPDTNHETGDEDSTISHGYPEPGNPSFAQRGVGEHPPTPDNHYADLRHLPSPKFACGAGERIMQRCEAAGAPSLTRGPADPRIAL